MKQNFKTQNYQNIFIGREIDSSFDSYDIHKNLYASLI